MSLYDDLGVDPNATPDEIKAAHRKGVRKTHPDAEGGDAEKFGALQRAYEVLSDEVRRRRYDETGQGDDKSAGAAAAALLENVYALVLAVSNDPGFDFDHDDLVAKVKERLAAMRLMMWSQREPFAKRLANLQKMGQRLKRKKKAKGKGNLILDAARRLQQDAAATVAEWDEKLSVHDAIVTMFDDFDYEFTPRPPEPASSWGQPDRGFMREAAEEAAAALKRNPGFFRSY